MKMKLHKLVALLLAVAMLLSMAACGKKAAQEDSAAKDQAVQQTQLSEETAAPEEETTAPEAAAPVKDENGNVVVTVDNTDRDSLEQIVDLLGGDTKTEDLDDEELGDLAQDLIQNMEEEKVQDIIDSDQPDVSVDVSENTGVYDENGAMTKPFDQVYPELVEDGDVTYDDESLLVKLNNSRNGQISSGMAAAGVAKLEAIVPMEETTWYEAKLVEGTDATAAVEALRQLSEVLLVEYNYEIRTSALDHYKDLPGDRDFGKNEHIGDQWHMHHCGIPDGMEEMATDGGDPSVIVAVIDTGVDYDHEDLADNIWKNTNEIPDNGIDDDDNGYIDDYYGVNVITGSGNGDDDNGHGTHVAGIIAAQNNNLGTLGIAYNVQIMPIKAAMASGYLHQSDIAKAILYAYNNGAEVINMSFGGSACNIAVQDALAVAYTRCVLVASAGNDSKPNEIVMNQLPNYPAALTYVLGVMSVDQYGVESSFTNYDIEAYSGVEYELYAPGTSIMSTLPNDQYGILSGTSMAAPVVSAMAAILRSEFTDRDMYPTKFIYGQLASTSGYHATCLDPELHGTHNLPQIVDLNAALTNMPKPEVNVQDYAYFDTEGFELDEAGNNTGEGVIDAGETIALGFTLRNRWGMSEDTVVSIDTLSLAGIPDPYIEILTEEVNYGSVGTYSTQDCGKVYTDVLHTGWENPFYIRIAENCPNDYIFNVNVTVTCGNALDETDTASYVETTTISLKVRNGTILPNIIEEDMVLTADNLYIIPNATTIQEGVTVRVEPGTHIQFWSDDEGDPYANSYLAYLRVDGKLLVEGTKENPVYIYPSDLMDHFNVELTEGKNGYIRLKYADITNLSAGNGNSGYDNEITLAENCTFRVNYGTSIYYRYLSGSTVYESSDSSYNIGTITTMRNCAFYKVGTIGGTPVLWGNAENCIFADCSINYGNGQEGQFTAVNCVFLGNVFQDQTQPSSYSNSKWGVSSVYTAGKVLPSGMTIHYREETGTTYVLYHRDSHIEKILNLYMDADFAVCETEEEFDWLVKTCMTDKWDDYYLGMTYDHDLQTYTYADGSAIQDFVDPDAVRLDYPGINKDLFPIVAYDSSAADWRLQKSDYTSGGSCYSIYEIPGNILPAEITFADYEVLMDMETTYQIVPISAPVPLGADCFLYESSDESVLTVSQTGLITPVSLGTADVKVYSQDKAVCNYITVKVVELVPLGGIAFAQESGEVAIGENLVTSCVLTPDNTSRRNVVYTSDAPDVVAVGENTGILTGISSGTATITATCEGMTATMKVTAYQKATTLDVETYLYESLVDDTQTDDTQTEESQTTRIVDLPQVEYDGEPALVWESTDTSVIQIADGKMELKKAGSTNLIVTDARTGLQDTAIVYVFEEGLPAVKSVVGTNSCRCVLLEDGRVFFWGDNLTDYKTPTLVLEDVKVCYSTCNYNTYEASILAVKNDGTVVYWSTVATTSGQWDDFKKTGDTEIDVEIAGVYVTGSRTDIKAYAWTTGGDLYQWNYWTESGAIPQLELSIQVAEMKTGINDYLYLLAQDGTLYRSVNGTGSDLQLIARNVTAFDDYYLDWYISDGVLYNEGVAADLDLSVFSQVLLQDYQSYSSYLLTVREGALSLHEVYVRTDIDHQTFKEHPIDLGEPVKQVFYDSLPYAVTESNVIYAIDWNSNYSVASTLTTEAFVLEEFEDDPFLVTGTNLEGDVLTGDALELTFNKIPVGTSGITLTEDGYTVAATKTLSNNSLIISSSVGFEAGHTYTLTLSAASFYASTDSTLAEDYTISFTYEEQDTEQDTDQDTEQEEAPVIHESVLDETIARIYTPESLCAKLYEMDEQYHINPGFYGNVILNHVSTDTNVSHWLRPTAPKATDYTEIPLGGNYWGTVNETAIGLQVVDYTDFSTYARLMTAPYLTEAPEDTFPFVTSVTLYNKAGEQVTTVGNEEVTFRVTFNRDMDTSIPLLVRFGSAYPYGDYEITEGAYVDARTWEGKYTLNTLIENGNQYFTISDGCSAEDDLMFYTDRARFGFEIDTTAAQALIMQGYATDTGIQLSWTQDDFDTLMGYNVYRATSEDGLYTRLNSTVIPADTMEFFDDTVEPGQQYYYNFTVVKTDLTESTPSGKITIMSKDTMAPDIYHSPVTTAYTGSNLVVSATVTDNLNIAYTKVYYRTTGTDTWKTAVMNNLNDKYSAIIPAADITLEGLEYYIEAFDGVSYTYKGSAQTPYLVTVQEAIGSESMGDVNGDGKISNLDALMILRAINDLYNMSEAEFVRADLDGSGTLEAFEALRILQYISGKVGSVDMRS